MARILFLALSLFTLTSCHPAQQPDRTAAAPVKQLASLEVKPPPPGYGAGKQTPEATPNTSEPVAEHNASSSAAETAPPPQNREALQNEEAKTAGGPATPASEDKPSEHSADTPQTPAPGQPGHEAWDALLRKHVSSSGKVDYKGLLASKDRLQAYLDELAATPPGKSWSRDEKLAYWINAYNAFTAKLILDHYPVSSIMDIHGGKPWDVKWIKLGDNTYSLNNIENDIIRPRFQEPRIHFAVNCAARSCPPLLNRAFTADNLNRYLDQQARSFINNPRFNTVSPRAVEISKIFEWYAADFGNIIDYLNQYAEAPANKGAKVSYREYDWSLNN